MPKSVCQIEELRAALARYAQKSPNAFSFSGLSGGIPRGALIEVSGPMGTGKTAWMASFLTEQNQQRAAWIEESLSVYPCALAQAGVDLSRLLFVEAGELVLWSAHQILRSGLVQLLFVSLERLIPGELELRRLQLACRDAQASLVLLKETPLPGNPWPVSLRLTINERQGILL